jgi:alkanesulfonate monooxygenase SsuD/methylene tetrahydromethanopterin reductase-like flavin-dependent oxidoreductase (luciferase family)
LLEVVTRLWTGEGVDYDGRFYQVEDASLGFGPTRTPPVYVPSAGFDPSEGFPKPIRNRLLEHADGWLPIAIPPETYAAGYERLSELLDDAGRNPESVDAAMYLDVVIGDEATAFEQARAFYDRYYPDSESFTDEELESQGAFGPRTKVAETLEAYREAGVETFVIRFTAENQREQLHEFARVADLG